jgi:Ni/Fe-hydrogenase 1 B-type cytochrome subunit
MRLEQELIEVEAAHPTTVRRVYVWQLPVRVWHWVDAAAIVALAVTGWFVASPPPSVPGEASGSFVFGTIRLVHFAAGYVFGVGLLMRIAWAIVGNEHARQIFVPPLHSPAWWRGVWDGLRWYAFVEKSPRHYVAHNPQAQFVLFVFFTIPALLMGVSGFALYAEGKGAGSWQDAVFGWLVPLVGGSQMLHTLHHLGMWGLLTFAGIHVYAVIRDDIMSRQSQLSSIVSGYRTFRG